MSVRFAALFGSCALALTAPAYAQSRDSQVTTLGAGLMGGDDNSYGYGAERSGEGDAVIDLRRNARRTTPVAETLPEPLAVDEPEAPAHAASASGERPPWLEEEQVGPPYQAEGRWYVPAAEPGYEQSGTASWYGAELRGRPTANGEIFDPAALTAAHPTLPLPSLVQVTNLENGREVIVRVNDRGPFVGGRVIDVSRGAAEALGFVEAGQARVHVRYLGPAPRRVGVDAGALPAANAEEGPSSLLPASAPAPVREPLAGASYYVQIGAFADLSNAHRVRDAASSAGPTAVDVRTTANGELFRVRVGPWNSREEAEAARQRVAALGYAEAVVAAP